MRGFTQFIREQGVIGLAVGFVLGGAVSKVVAALVGDIINPLVSVALGMTAGIKTASFGVGGARIMWGDFVTVIIDFLIVALVVYYGFKILGLEKLDKSR